MKDKYIRLVDGASIWKGHGTVSCLQFDSDTDRNTETVALASEKKTGFIGI